MNNVTLYKKSNGKYSLSKVGEVHLETGISDARTRNIVLRCLSALGENRDEFNEMEAASVVRIMKEFGATDLYMEQYPDSGYKVRRGLRGLLVVTCPAHGDFEISETNFLYLRGCAMCRGVHHRAYPVRSHRKWGGNPVYLVRGPSGLEVTQNSDVGVFGVGYSDQRIAKMVETLVSNLLVHGLYGTVVECMKAAHTFKIKREHLKKVSNVAGNAVFLEKCDGVWKLGGPDQVYSNATHIAFYTNRPYAELIHHIIATLRDSLPAQEWYLTTQTILNVSGNKHAS